MWPRITELLIGLWLAASPLSFGAADFTSSIAINCVLCGAVVAAASILSLWERVRHARMATALAGLWLLAFSYFMAGRPAALELQNLFVCGLLLILFVVVPNDASQPPRPWRKFVSSAADERRPRHQ